MENKNIIIILIVIIIILLAAIGFSFLNPTTAKQPAKVKITSDKSQYIDDAKLSIKLSDLNNTPISNQIVNITIAEKGEVVVDSVVKTNEKGNAKLELELNEGQYDVNVSYGGNENYTANSTTQKLTVKEREVVESAPEQTSDSQDVLNYDSELNLYYDSNGIVVDPDGAHGQAVGDNYYYLKDLADRGITP